MTVISKIKTLIEYAKFGMFICKRTNGDRDGELYFPKAITDYTISTADWRVYAVSMRGRVKRIGGNNFLLNNTTVKTIDLPECNNLLTYAWGANSTLETVILPSVRETNASIFQNFTALKYLELGSLVKFNAATIKGCTALTDFRVGEGTMCGLYLQYCPNLTRESLHSIIENFADMSGVEAPHTIYFGAENLAKIDEDHIGIMETKNINYQ